MPSSDAGVTTSSLLWPQTRGSHHESGRGPDPFEALVVIDAHHLAAAHARAAAGPAHCDPDGRTSGESRPARAFGRVDYRREVDPLLQDVFFRSPIGIAAICASVGAKMIPPPANENSGFSR